MPPGHNVDAKPSAGDVVDRRRHAGDESRMERGQCHRGEELDALGDGSQPRHQGEGFQVMIPERRPTAKTPEFDHRQEEVEAVRFCVLGDGAVEPKRRHVLGGVDRHHPTVVPDRNENPEIHRPSLLLRSSWLHIFPRPNAPAELRPTGENARNNPQSLRCGPSAPVGCSVWSG